MTKAFGPNGVEDMATTKGGVIKSVAVRVSLGHAFAFAITMALGTGLAIAQAQAPPSSAPAAPVRDAPSFVPGPQDLVKSPEVQPNGVVTFRIYAPDAKTVRLQAEGMEATPGMTKEEAAKGATGYPLTRGDGGVWTLDFGPVQPGVYRYVFLVDGVRVDDPRNPVASQSLNSVWSMYEVPGASFLEYKRDVPHGSIASVWYDSAAAGGLRRMHVYTPPGYEEAKGRYPVLYLLHGAMDTDDSWGTVGRAGAILDNLIAEHKAKPMIVVLPAGHMSRDFKMGVAAGKTIGHDGFIPDMLGSVMPYVESHYRTLNDRNDRAIAGLSMGGVQTLDLSILHSDLFSYVGVFSSGWFIQGGETDAKEYLAQYKANGKPFHLYWMGVGKLDGVKKSADTAAGLLRDSGINVTFHESEGFHAWNNWRDYLDMFAPLLFTANEAQAQK